LTTAADLKVRQCFFRLGQHCVAFGEGLDRWPGIHRNVGEFFGDKPLKSPDFSLEICPILPHLRMVIWQNLRRILRKKTSLATGEHNVVCALIFNHLTGKNFRTRLSFSIRFKGQKNI
jgi:hypothetical protein